LDIGGIFICGDEFDGFAVIFSKCLIMAGVGVNKMMMAPISVAKMNGEAFVQSEFIGSSPYTIYGGSSTLFAPKMPNSSARCLWRKRWRGGFPKVDFYGIGTLTTHTLAHAAACPDRPLPWPKQPLAPMMLDVKSVDHKMHPGQPVRRR
jgi:hypothetical protein